MTVTLVYGESSSYKSFWALNRAMHTAQAGRVVFLTGDGINSIGLRLRAWVAHHDMMPLKDNTLFMESNGQGQPADITDEIRGLNIPIKLVVIDDFLLLMHDMTLNSEVKSKRLLDGLKPLTDDVLIVLPAEKSGRPMSAKGLIKHVDEVIEIRVGGDKQIIVDYQKGNRAGEQDQMSAHIVDIDDETSSLVLVDEGGTP